MSEAAAEIQKLLRDLNEAMREAAAEGITTVLTTSVHNIGKDGAHCLLYDAEMTRKVVG